MAEPDDLLLSDAERLHALTVLGDHYASGRLDDSQFHARSGDVAAARTLAQLRDSFADLPGGTPLTSVDGMIVQSATAGGGEVALSSSSPSSLVPAPTGARTPATRDADADLEDLRRRGKLVESLDGVVIGLTLITFLVLQIVVDWQYAWIVWPSLVLTLGIPRLALRFTDSDEKTYEKLKKADEKAREERLRAASERIRELGDRREKRD
ncbi:MULTISPECIES: DUF1707 SHOCT-like domain-containing protein [Dietzia]|uniref:DUF1707 domain-containing protein n=1 Tax=Dietzia cinnamea TaxID=321318 RepID=A0AAW5Q9T7_9ACTN|nr:MULTISPECIES: DUF1707 domain-containing protein [Dietzia]EFV93592.1 hypothetical protein ES5_00035 [Dietzia cinnamea P4]MBM7231805.1 DUF1707 domain-containing protein [Dietzia cinnamea]MCT1640292.1 DUF1707 domain-containing protein [Dietzia cinnamea]MCT1864738.1 DUF1707 domain-containing protein [Dietzia cinnamea]MCT1885656.1 DUF1707 domain-containing protein [Dietzia cinnamea]